MNLAKLSLVNATEVRKAANDAVDWTDVFYTGARGHNDNADAFRHALWNAFMVKRIGYAEAKKWADAHEDYPNNPELEKRMDLHNNNLGRSLYTYTQNHNLADKIRQAIRNGKGLRFGIRRARPALVPTGW